MDFMNQMQNELNTGARNVAVTENGAIGYRTTGKSLLDLNFAVASLRSAKEHDIVNRFLLAYGEDKTLALKWLFFARDVRQGLGERRLFRVVARHMAIHQPEEVRHLLEYFAEYGRWDDLLELMETKLEAVVVSIVGAQLQKDKQGMANEESISLLAKWMPSVNSSSDETCRRGKRMAKLLGIDVPNYRKMLSKMRKYIDVIEVKMSSKRWDEINYETVPSRANLLYSDAFLRNDETRRRGFLAALEKGEATINAGTLFPHDIIWKYYQSRMYDAALEGLWKALPDVIDPESSTLVVVDGSGSMESNKIGNTNIPALMMSYAMGIYFAEKLQGQFHNKYITFSGTPQIVNLNGCNTLAEKINLARRFTDVSNTDIERTFDLILDTAVKGHAKQEELPANILCISDMEFDGGCQQRPDFKLFEVIRARFEAHNYKMPRLIFWNVNSRTGAIPLIENELGIVLVSGFSLQIAKMVMSGQTDPFECLKETLLSERYAPIVSRSE